MIQEEVDEKLGSDYCIISTEEFIDMIGTLDARDDRRRAAREAQKTFANKKKAQNPYEADSNSESSPRVTRKKHNPKPGKGNNRRPL